MSQQQPISDDSSISIPESTVPKSAAEPVAAPKKRNKAEAPLAAPVPAQPKDTDAGEEAGQGMLVFVALPSWLTSLVVHFILVLILALFYLPSLPKLRNDLTVGTTDPVETEVSNFEENSAEIDVNLDALQADMSVLDAPPIPTEDPAMVDDPHAMEAVQMNVELSSIGFEAAETTDLMQEVGAFMGSGVEGRSAAERARLVIEAGGSEGSEQAVKRALQWLKRHQNPDGSWSFMHLGGRCKCPGHGAMVEARIGATAIALLPFLGAGNTHQSGNYQSEVSRGLYYLLNRQQANGSLWEEGGNMYSHGLAAIVLCEAYAMTNDKSLLRPAQASLNFIAYAQDPTTGGWRYEPRDMSGGDTSVVGWQLMALKSGHMGQLGINAATIKGTNKFLNLVQANKGATYGYMAPGEKPATTAIGLLCRMYLGWSRSHTALREGVRRLSKSGPSPVNLYYNYYATQVMRHYGGEPWEKWNGQMRDWLVKQQNRRGHADGSWYMGRQHTDKGGRLYCTAMATMILEVYYRHLPIYGSQAAEKEFQL